MKVITICLSIVEKVVIYTSVVFELKVGVNEGRALHSLSRRLWSISDLRRSSISVLVIAGNGVWEAERSPACSAACSAATRSSDSARLAGLGDTWDKVICGVMSRHSLMWLLCDVWVEERISAERISVEDGRADWALAVLVLGVFDRVGLYRKGLTMAEFLGCLPSLFPVPASLIKGTGLFGVDDCWVVATSARASAETWLLTEESGWTEVFSLGWLVDPQLESLRLSVSGRTGRGDCSHVSLWSESEESDSFAAVTAAGVLVSLKEMATTYSGTESPSDLAGDFLFLLASDFGLRSLFWTVKDDCSFGLCWGVLGESAAEDGFQSDAILLTASLFLPGGLVVGCLHLFICVSVLSVDLALGLGVAGLAGEFMGLVEVPPVTVPRYVHVSWTRTKKL